MCEKQVSVTNKETDMYLECRKGEGFFFGIRGTSQKSLKVTVKNSSDQKILLNIDIEKFLGQKREKVSRKSSGRILAVGEEYSYEQVFSQEMCSYSLSFITEQMFVDSDLDEENNTHESEEPQTEGEPQKRSDKKACKECKHCDCLSGITLDIP